MIVYKFVDPQMEEDDKENMTIWTTLPNLTPYSKALELMEGKLYEVIENKSPETIFLLEHEDIYTAGTNHKPEELLGGNQIPVVKTGRGGKFTYHGPGQRVIYPILDLRKKNRQQDIKLYIKMLEQWIINTLGRFGIKAYTIKDMIGIWTDLENGPAKIGAIGVRIKKWVAYHGIAVNIKTDLSKYSGIIPCGIDNYPVTSLHKLGVEISLEEFDSVLKEEFGKIFK